MLDRIAPDGRLLGIEADPRTLTETSTRLNAYGSRAVLVNGNFRALKELAAGHGFNQVDAVFFDLGLSSLTLEDAERGFSFQLPGPLDMRFDPIHQTLTAADIVSGSSKDELAKIFREYGEEPAAEKIAATIVQRRQHAPLLTTADLAELISGIVHRRGKRHPATLTFQALRIAVNDELNALRDALPQAWSLLKVGGRLGVISFHSLEDRLVKVWMKDKIKTELASTPEKKAIQAAYPERRDNPRARSAKYRIIIKNKN
jgi:16S rRNA (cytosine1402-N4)-methyltransferase